MNPFRKLAGQTAIYGIPSILVRFLNYLLVPLYTYGLLTQQEYGVVNLFFSYTALLMVILTYGMETAFFRFSETENDRPKVYSTGFFSLLITSAAFLLLCSLFPSDIARWIDYPDHPDYILWFAWIMALDAISAIPFARLRSLNRPIRFALIKSVNIFTNIASNVFFLLICPVLYAKAKGTGWEAVVRVFYRPDYAIEYIFLSLLLASAVTVIMLIPYLRDLKLSIDKQLWMRMLMYGIPLMFAGMAGIVNETVDRILLRYLLPMSPADAEAQIGIYSACNKIAVLMVLFTQAYRFAAEPFFFSHMKKADAKVLYARTMDYYMIAVTSIFLITMLFLDTVFIRLTGPGFRSAKAVIPVLMLAKLFVGVYYNLSIWYKLTGKTFWGVVITFIGAAITIILNVIFIPLSPDHLIHGYLGSAYAALACYTIMMILGYLIGQKYFPINYDLKKFFGYLGLALLIYAVSQWIRPEAVILSLGFNLLLLAAFAGVVWKVEAS